MTATDGQTDSSVSNLYVIIPDTEMFEPRCDKSEYIFFAVRYIFFSLLSSNVIGGECSCRAGTVWRCMWEVLGSNGVRLTVFVRLPSLQTRPVKLEREKFLLHSSPLTNLPTSWRIVLWAYLNIMWLFGTMMTVRVMTLFRTPYSFGSASNDVTSVMKMEVANCRETSITTSEVARYHTPSGWNCCTGLLIWSPLRCPFQYMSRVWFPAV
jgi:hypothetical protein